MLGLKVKEARKRRGLTQKDLAAIIGLKQASLSQIESGKVTPMRKTLIAIGRALDDDFGMEWVREGMAESGPSPPTRKELAEEMSVREFISLKFGGAEFRRSREELDMLTKLLDAEVERIKREGF